MLFQNIKKAIDTLFITGMIFHTTSAMAAASMHAIGPDNETDLTHLSCELSDNALSYFDGQNNFYTLYKKDNEEQCYRALNIEDNCKPYLAYCSNKMYKYKSTAVFIFTPECTDKVFQNKAFLGMQSKDQACKSIEDKRKRTSNKNPDMTIR